MNNIIDFLTTTIDTPAEAIPAAIFWLVFFAVVFGLIFYEDG